MTNKPTSIHLSVRRWRDKTYGNSYFSARVYADGQEVARLPFQYGYGSQPEFEAMAALNAPADGSRYPYIGMFCRAVGIRYTEDDVFTTKRECIAHGKGE